MKNIAVVAVALAGLLTVGTRFAVAADPSDGRTLEGTWLVEVTLRDCATNAPPSFYSLLSFGRAGTLIETTNNAGFLPGQRGPGPRRVEPSRARRVRREQRRIHYVQLRSQSARVARLHARHSADRADDYHRSWRPEHV